VDDRASDAPQTVRPGNPSGRASLRIVAKVVLLSRPTPTSRIGVSSRRGFPRTRGRAGRACSPRPAAAQPTGQVSSSRRTGPSRPRARDGTPIRGRPSRRRRSCRAAAAAPPSSSTSFAHRLADGKKRRGAPSSPARGCQFGNGCSSSGFSSSRRRISPARGSLLPAARHAVIGELVGQHRGSAPLVQAAGAMPDRRVRVRRMPEAPAAFALLDHQRRELGREPVVLVEHVVRDQVAFVVDRPERPRCTVEAVVARLEPVVASSSSNASTRWSSVMSNAAPRTRPSHRRAAAGAASSPRWFSDSS
jgi:hypothetical protein